MILEALARKVGLMNSSSRTGVFGTGIRIFCSVPFRTSARARPALLLLLLALHFPMNSTLGAIDYPWIATSFYPLFFRAEEWAQIEAELARWQRSQLLAAAGSVLLFVLLTPRDLFIYQAAVGAAVSALWGYAVPSLLRRVRPGLLPQKV